MGRVRLHLNNKLVTRLLVFALVCFLFLVIPTTFYFFKYKDKIYPNIKVAGINLGGFDILTANKVLSEETKKIEKIKIIGQNQTYNLDLKNIDFSYDIEGTVQRAYNYTRSGNFFYDASKRFTLLKTNFNFGLSTNINEDKLSKFISIVSGQNSIEATNPSIEITNGAVVVNTGTPGVEVDQNQLRALIGKNLTYSNEENIIVPTNLVDNSLTKEQAETLKSRAENLLGKKIIAKFEYSTFTLSDSEIIKFINPLGDYDKEFINESLEKISKQIGRPPQNPKFSFENGKVTEFLPAKDGIKAKNKEFTDLVIAALSNLEKSTEKTIEVEIPVEKTPPEITTEKVNNLGIKELIGRGTSTYFHSIPSRVHNVALATSRINGTLIAPGETFSFNQTLGDVSQFTGYQQAYIISGGKTILGDGGGVCQVSTTLFRSLLNGGLPILERSPHAYRVGYYEQNSPPGFDATVYGPTPDLKFTNDTNSYILIQAQADPKKYSLVVELYGTSDGRVSTISKPTISNISPAPEDRYQDDPSLPVGTIKQIDFKASGAKVVFNYSVKKNGEEIFNKTFISNYRPWQAVYLRGTSPTQ